MIIYSFSGTGKTYLSKHNITKYKIYDCDRYNYNYQIFKFFKNFILLTNKSNCIKLCNFVILPTLDMKEEIINRISKRNQNEFDKEIVNFLNNEYENKLLNDEKKAIKFNIPIYWLKENQYLSDVIKDIISSS